MASETIRGGYTTFLHEFGHTLGLTDDYSGRLGRFSIYCDGTFNGGIIPVNFNAMERLMLGWLDYEVIDREGEYTLEPLAKNKGLLLKTGATAATSPRGTPISNTGECWCGTSTAPKTS